MEILCIPVGRLAANCYVVWDDGKKAVVIDPGDDFENIKRKIAAAGVSVEKIILTHGHFDHLGACAQLKEYTNAPVYAYIDEKIIIENDKYSLGYVMGDRYIRPSVDVYVNDNDIITCGELSFKVIHTPGHTGGGMCLYIDNFLFSGDTIFRKYIGRCDHPTGDIKLITKSILEKIFTLPDDTVIYPGHDEKTTVGQEKSDNEVYQWL